MNKTGVGWMVAESILTKKDNNIISGNLEYFGLKSYMYFSIGNVTENYFCTITTFEEQPTTKH